MIKESIRNDAMGATVRWSHWGDMHRRKATMTGCSLSFATHLYKNLASDYTHWDMEQLHVHGDLDTTWFAWSKLGETEVQLRITRNRLGGYTIRIIHYWDNEVHNV